MNKDFFKKKSIVSHTGSFHSFFLVGMDLLSIELLSLEFAMYFPYPIFINNHLAWFHSAVWSWNSHAQFLCLRFPFRHLISLLHCWTISFVLLSFYWVCTSVCVCYVQMCVYERVCAYMCMVAFTHVSACGGQKLTWARFPWSLLYLIFWERIFFNMNITISARLAREQKMSAETKQQMGRQKLISRELMLVNMEFSKYVQYASETDDKKKNDRTSPWQGRRDWRLSHLQAVPSWQKKAWGSAEQERGNYTPAMRWRLLLLLD